MIRLVARAFLFDLDGTLIDSLAAVDRAWSRFCRMHGLDPASVIPTIHGKRSIDSIRRLLPSADAEAEDAKLRRLEAGDCEGVVRIPGAVELLSKLPRERWAIVTSGTRDVAMARIAAAGLPKAGAYVFGDDVKTGKPSPEPYLLGAARLKVEPADCIGFEDAAAGIASLSSAGVQPIGIGPLADGAALMLVDYTRVDVEVSSDRLTLCIDS